MNSLKFILASYPGNGVRQNMANKEDFDLT